MGQRGFGKTIPRAEHIFIGFAELSAGCGVHAVISKGQGKQRSFTDRGIKFSADEEVCGCQGVLWESVQCCLDIKTLSSRQKHGATAPKYLVDGEIGKKLMKNIS